MFIKFYSQWYILCFCLILAVTNINCENVDQKMKREQTIRVCENEQSNFIEVTNRKPDTFTCHISYNCRINSSVMLAVFEDDKISINCNVKLSSRNEENTTVAVTCKNIENNAGRNWIFIFGSKDKNNQIIANETFVITLEPFPLKLMPNFDVRLNEEITLTSIFIPNCHQISETKYLGFKCHNDDNIHKSISENCTFICPIKSDSIYNISLIRFPISKNDGTENMNGEFPMDERIEKIHIGKACHNAQSSDISIVKRTSTMFTFKIFYDCLITNSDKLFVFKNYEIVEECKLNLTYIPVIEKTNVILTCDNIQNNAGQNWKFLFGTINNQNSIIINETFIITLEPFPINNINNINITVNENISLTSIYIPDCDKIAEKKYLRYQCGMGDKENRTIYDNCTFICPVNPGVIHDFAILRFPIPKYDGKEILNGTFPFDRKPFMFQTNPDKATNFNVDIIERNKTALISFTRPRDYFDYITMNCFAYQTCTNSTYYLTNNVYKSCTNCTHIPIAPLLDGVNYKCWVNISRSGGNSINYEAIDFNTHLKGVVYKQTWLSNQTDIDVNLIVQSDFENIESICKANDKQKPFCIDRNKIHDKCSIKFELKLNLIRGCNYQCYFLTKKQDYNNAYSLEFPMSIPPPKPIITSSTWTSSYILVEWTIEEPTYIESISVIVNDTSMLVPDIKARSFKYTKNILPNQEYSLHIELISNEIISSDKIYNKTPEDDEEKSDWPGKKSSSLLWLICIPIFVILNIVGVIAWKRKAIQIYFSKRHGSKSVRTNAEFVE